jgi:hypothetical protein
MTARSLFSLALALTPLAGCGVSTSDIVPAGRDSYLLDTTSRGGLFAGKERVDGLKTANVYCEQQGRHMIIRRTDTTGIAGIGPVTNSLIFSCVTSDDPEYQRPNLQHDVNAKIIVEDRR